MQVDETVGHRLTDEQLYTLCDELQSQRIAPDDLSGAALRLHAARRCTACAALLCLTAL